MLRHFFILTVLLTLTACNRAPTPPTTTAPATPRIISLVPAASLNLTLMNATEHLVGVSSYDFLYLPENQRTLPKVGDYQTIDYEQLIKLKPTTVIIQFATERIPPKLSELSQSQHFELVNIRFDNTADIWTSVRTLGKVAGIPETAEKSIEFAQTDLRAVALQYKDKPRPKVLYLVSPKLMLVSGGKTFIDEMITAAGAENAGATIGDGFIETSRETLVKLAPDVLLISALEETGEMQNDPRLDDWKKLPIPAARNNRVHLVTDGNILMASINIGKNVKALADVIHQGDPPTTTPTTAPARGNP